MNKQEIQRILTDAGEQLRRECDEINADFMLLFWPYPKMVAQGLGVAHLRQVERRVERAAQIAFETAVQEARRDQARSN